MRVLVAGCGWLGREVATRLQARGDSVAGLTRTLPSAARLRRDGIEAMACDLVDPAASRQLTGGYDGVVAMLSAGGRDVEAYRRAYVEATRSLLGSAFCVGVRFIYVGSTGVFGQTGGSWVDESTTPLPSDPTAEVLVDAETLVLDRRGHAAFPCIVRCSGLYGPGRAGTIERVRSGDLAQGPGDETWMNFCHRDDAAQTVIAALDRGRPGAVYHASDEAPATRREVVSWISARLEIPPPQRDDETDTKRRRRTNRRIGAAATRRELGVELAYPSFREGFASLTAASAAS